MRGRELKLEVFRNVKLVEWIVNGFGGKVGDGRNKVVE